MSDNVKQNLFTSKLKLYICDLILFIVLIALDQFAKYLAIMKLKAQAPFVIFDGIFELHYLENHGSAFGMLQNQKILILLISGAFMLILLFLLLKIPNEKKFLWLHLMVSLIIAGGIGNMIDRIRFDYVVDFIYFKLINYPIFNIADIYVVVGTICLGILCIFVYKESDLSFLDFKK